jgi:hypothetical protein
MPTSALVDLRDTEQLISDITRHATQLVTAPSRSSPHAAVSSLAYADDTSIKASDSLSRMDQHLEAVAQSPSSSFEPVSEPESSLRQRRRKQFQIATSEPEMHPPSSISPSRSSTSQSDSSSIPPFPSSSSSSSSQSADDEPSEADLQRFRKTIQFAHAARLIVDVNLEFQPRSRADSSSNVTVRPFCISSLKTLFCLFHETI